MNNMKKPPLGVTPKAIFIELRIRDLSRAIYEYACFGDYSRIEEWSQELLELIERSKSNGT